MNWKSVFITIDFIIFENKSWFQGNDHISFKRGVRIGSDDSFEIIFINAWWRYRKSDSFNSNFNLVYLGDERLEQHSTKVNPINDEFPLWLNSDEPIFGYSAFRLFFRHSYSNIVANSVYINKNKLTIFKLSFTCASSTFIFSLMAIPLSAENKLVKFFSRIIPE